MTPVQGKPWVGRAGLCFGVEPSVVHARPQRLDRASLLALAAAQQVLTAPEREDLSLGVAVLTEWGAFSANAEHWLRVRDVGPAQASPLVFPATVPSAAAAELAIAFSAMGANVTECGGAADWPAFVAGAQALVAAGAVHRLIVCAVDGGHPALTHYGVAEQAVDGAVAFILSADVRCELGGWTERGGLVVSVSAWLEQGGVRAR